MLEINKRYEVELLDLDGTSRLFVRGISMSVDQHLLALKTDEGERIFNTASSVFIGVREYRIPEKGSIYSPIDPPRGAIPEGFTEL